MPAHVAFVPIDLRHEGLRDPLIDAGFLEGRPCFVICEGVTEYLDEQTVDAILRFVARSTAPGSEIAFTYLDRAMLEGTRNFRGGRCRRAINRESREPFAFGIDPQRLEGDLAKQGFRLLDDAAGAELDRRHFQPRGRRERSNEYQHVALASLRVGAAAPIAVAEPLLGDRARRAGDRPESDRRRISFECREPADGLAVAPVWVPSRKTARQRQTSGRTNRVPAALPSRADTVRGAGIPRATTASSGRVRCDRD